MHVFWARFACVVNVLPIGAIVSNWTPHDYFNSKCSYEQIGKPKDDAPIPVDAPADDDKPAREQLKRDAIAAYKALGGPEYFRRNQELLDKALLKMIAEPVQQTDTTVRIVVDAPWLNPDRLSYQRDIPKADVVDVPPVENPPADWREKQPHPGPVLIPKDEEAERLLNGPPKG